MEVNMYLQMTEDDMKHSRFLMERIHEAQKAVYESINSKSISGFYENKKQYENACLNFWEFNYTRFGILPTVTVKLPF